MRIGYIRLNSDIRLNLSSPNNGQGIEHRRAFLHALLAQEHEVTITSRISNQDLPLLKIRGEWYNKLKYDLDADPNNFDVVILEAASSNPRFSRELDHYYTHLPDGKTSEGRIVTGTRDKVQSEIDTWNQANPDKLVGPPLYGEEVSMLQFSMRLLNKYKGNIFLWHHIYGQTSLFPFTQNLKPSKVPIEQLSPINWRRVLGDLNLFEDKKWTILHHALNEDGFRHVRSSRFAFCYADLPEISFKYIHLPKSDLDPWYPINPSPRWDSLYIGSRYTNSVTGSEYDRLPNVKKFYDTKLYTGAVLGHMGQSSATHSHSKIEENPFQYAQRLHTDNSSIEVAMGFWHNSLTHTFCESTGAEKIGSMTGRTFLSLRSGSVLFVDKSISGVEKLGLSEFEVSSPEEIKSKIDYLRSVSSERRDEIRQTELRTFPDWSEIQWDQILKP